MALVYRCLLPFGWYVGITTKTLERRKAGHLALTKRPKLAFHRALQLAKNDAVWEVIATCDWETAKIIEVDLIKSYKKILPGIGYNLTLGGEGVLGVKFSAEVRRKMSERMKGRKLSEETKARVSLSKRNGPHPLRGKKMPKEWRDKIVAASTGRRNTKATKRKMSESALARWANKTTGFFDVFTIDGSFVGRWGNHRVCAEELNLHQSGIGNCLCGIAKTHGGYIFKRVTDASP